MLCHTEYNWAKAFTLLHQVVYALSRESKRTRLGIIQVLRHQRDGWMGSENGNFLIRGWWVGLKKSKT